MHFNPSFRGPTLIRCGAALVLSGPLKWEAFAGIEDALRVGCLVAIVGPTGPFQVVVAHFRLARRRAPLLYAVGYSHKAWPCVGHLSAASHIDHRYDTSRRNPSARPPRFRPCFPGAGTGPESRAHSPGQRFNTQKAWVAIVRSPKHPRLKTPPIFRRSKMEWL